jgi:hypothetical protein
VKPPVVSFVCPLCPLVRHGARVDVFDDGDGPQDKYLTHADPPCERFLALSPVQYLTAARVAGARSLS